MCTGKPPDVSATGNQPAQYQGGLGVKVEYVAQVKSSSNIMET